MRMDKGHLEACHEGVHIIARIADECDALLVARQIATAGCEKQLGWIGLIVKIGRANRAAAVEGLEIRARRADVPQRIDVGLHAQR